MLFELSKVNKHRTTLFFPILPISIIFCYNVKMARERLSSRLGFILLSAGCAIGCGNVWKFPWMVGQNGGGAFVLVYLVFLVLLGLPALTMEFALGRASQASPVRMYQKLEKPGSKWHIHGYICLLGNIFLMAFYTVVTGWLIYYFVSFVAGKSSELSFVKMISNPRINVMYLFIAVAVCFTILTRNLQSGLERITKYMMVMLLILMTVLAVRSITLKGGTQGLSFYLVPDFKKLTVPVIVAAMNQAFFTLSIGIGAMAIFGSYIGKDRSLMGETVKVIILDTFVAIVAGLIIFPACASFNIAVDAGPSLLFNTMTTVFNNMGGGRIWGSLFFLFMVFAAFSTELAVCENILACVREMTGWSRIIRKPNLRHRNLFNRINNRVRLQRVPLPSIWRRLSVARFLGLHCKQQPSSTRCTDILAVLLQQQIRTRLAKPYYRSKRGQRHKNQKLDETDFRLLCSTMHNRNLHNRACNL